MERGGESLHMFFWNNRKQRVAELCALQSSTPAECKIDAHAGVSLVVVCVLVLTLMNVAERKS